MTFTELTDFNVFLNYGSTVLDLQKETESDIYVLMLQMQRSLFYNRKYGGGAGNMEGNPLSLIQAVLVKAEIVESIQRRNNELPDSGEFDRRVAVSQTEIEMEYDALGQVDLSLNYIPYNNLSERRSLSSLTGGINAG